MRGLWIWFLKWFTGEPEEYLTCPTGHALKNARMRWEEEVVEYYEECVDCGKEFYAD